MQVCAFGTQKKDHYTAIKSDNKLANSGKNIGVTWTSIDLDSLFFFVKLRLAHKCISYVIMCTNRITCIGDASLLNKKKKETQIFLHTL